MNKKIIILLLIALFFSTKYKKSINRATYEDLVKIGTIDKVKATKILEERKNGFYVSVVDLDNRTTGIGEKGLNELKQHFRF